MTTTNYGIPTEAELENLANSLFTDFDPKRCAKGIDAWLSTGDTSVIGDAAAKFKLFHLNFQLLLQKLLILAYMAACLNMSR